MAADAAKRVEGKRVIMQGDNRLRLRELDSGSVHTCVTSPPYYGLRDYGVDGQIGLEETPEEYVKNLVEVFREVRRVLRDDGTLWINLGDSYASSTKGSGGIGKSTLGSASGGNGISAEGIIRSQQRQSMTTRHFDLKQTGLKPKDLIGIPWRVAFALQADGWYLRSDVIWSKPNPMPESVTDRPTKSHEYIFLLSKSERYYYDHEAIKEPVTASTLIRMVQDIDSQRGSDRANAGGKTNGVMKAVGDGSERNKRTVWTVSTASFSEAHFATFPPKLIEPCILAGSPVGGIVLDPFNGAGTTGLVAMQHGREYIGIELNPEYIEITERRLSAIQPVMNF